MLIQMIKMSRRDERAQFQRNFVKLEEFIKCPMRLFGLRVIKQ